MYLVLQFLVLLFLLLTAQQNLMHEFYYPRSLLMSQLWEMDSEIIFSSACHGWPCNVSTFLDTSLKGFSMPLDCLVLAFGYTCYLQEIPILKSSARIAAQLNYLCPRFFPTPACLSLHYHNNEMQPSPASRSCFKAFSKQFAENLLKIWEGGCWQCCEKSDMCLDLSYPSWSSCRVSKNTCFAARFVKGSSAWTNAGYRANAA